MNARRRSLAALLAVILIIALIGSVAADDHGTDDDKLDEFLEDLADDFEIEGEEAAKDEAELHGLRVRPGGLVPVILEPLPGQDSDSIDSDVIEELGGQVDATSRSFVRVLVPFAKLRSIATHPDVRIVRAQTRAVELHGEGPNVSESVGLTGAEGMHVAGIDGTGTRIAIVDLGFIGLSARISEGELPADTVAVDLPGGHDNPTLEAVTAHGVGVAEHVADVAPGARIYCIMVGDEVDLQNAADYIKANGIQIANHSVGWVNASHYDDTGPINDIINSSHDVDGVFWTVAAGNDAKRHWGVDGPTPMTTGFSTLPSATR